MKLLALSLTATVMMIGATQAQQPAASQPARPASAAATQTAAAKQICKRSADIGTLVQRRKECHTRAEWDRLAQDARAAGQSMAERSMTGGSPQ